MNGSLMLPSLWQRGICAVGQRYSHLPARSSLLRCLTTTSTTETGGTTAKSAEDFFEKNKRLNRPMSPHLTIYQFQITSMLSITHRGTGLALTGVTSLFAFGSLLSSSSFPTLLAAVESAQYGSPLIFVAKYLLAFPLVFHTLNGVRHLAWDMGKGFELKQVYASGYGVLGSSVLLSLALAAM